MNMEKKWWPKSPHLMENPSTFKTFSIDSHWIQLDRSSISSIFIYFHDWQIAFGTSFSSQQQDKYWTSVYSLSCLTNCRIPFVEAFDYLQYSTNLVKWPSELCSDFPSPSLILFGNSKECSPLLEESTIAGIQLLFRWWGSSVAWKLSMKLPTQWWSRERVSFVKQNWDNRGPRVCRGWKTQRTTRDWRDQISSRSICNDRTKKVSVIFVWLLSPSL